MFVSSLAPVYRLCLHLRVIGSLFSTVFMLVNSKFVFESRVNYLMFHMFGVIQLFCLNTEMFLSHFQLDTFLSHTVRFNYCLWPYSQFCCRSLSTLRPTDCGERKHMIQSPLPEIRHCWANQVSHAFRLFKKKDICFKTNRILVERLIWLLVFPTGAL